MVAAPTQPAQHTSGRMPSQEWHVTGLRLYILFATADAERFAEESEEAIEAIPPLVTDRFWIGQRQIEGWHLRHVALGATASTLTSNGVPASAVPDLAQEMLSEAQAAERQAGRSGQVRYLLLYLEELHPPTLTHPRVQRRGKEPIWPVTSVRPALRRVLDRFDPLVLDEPRGYFEHYEQKTAARPGHHGYIAIGRTAAVIADLSDQSLTVLATLLQSGALAPSGGLTSEGLSTVLTRMTQWNANQDVRESVDHLFDLKRGGDAATRGQVWLAYALAIIGISLSLIGYVHEPALVTPGLVVMGLTCVCYATYAQTANPFWFRLGVSVFALGVALTATGLVLGIAAPAAVPLPFFAVPTPTPSPTP